MKLLKPLIPALSHCHRSVVMKRQIQLTTMVCCDGVFGVDFLNTA